MVTQRQEPKMTLISTAIHGGLLYLGFLSTVLEDDVADPIIVDIPLHEDDLIKYLKDIEQSNEVILESDIINREANIDRFKRNILIWADKVEAIDCGPLAAAFFDSIFTERKGRYRLVRMMDQFDRKTFVGSVGGDEVGASPEDIAQKAIKPFGTVSLADSRPILLASVASLKDLNKRLVRHTKRQSYTSELEMDMLRFRPNIVVDGCSAWAEDSWNSVQFASLKDVNFYTIPCSRCKVPTNNPYTGEFDIDDEPNVTLKNFHTGAHIGLLETKKQKTVYIYIQ